MYLYNVKAVKEPKDVDPDIKLIQDNNRQLQPTLKAYIERYTLLARLSIEEMKHPFRPAIFDAKELDKLVEDITDRGSKKDIHEINVILRNLIARYKSNIDRLEKINAPSYAAPRSPALSSESASPPESESSHCTTPPSSESSSATSPPANAPFFRPIKEMTLGTQSISIALSSRETLVHKAF